MRFPGHEHEFDSLFKNYIYKDRMKYSILDSVVYFSYPRATPVLGSLNVVVRVL